MGSQAVGFIGAGTIGGPMARRLLETGHALVVHDRRPEALQSLVAAGAREAESPREVSERRRILPTSLPGPAGLYLGLADLFLKRGFDTPLFQLALAEKDVVLALDSARELAVPMPVVAAGHQTYLRAVAQGLGSSAFFATLRAVEAAAAVEVPKPRAGS